MEAPIQAFGTGQPDYVNLTKYEILALDAEISVSDGHPRQRPTARQSAILARLTELFLDANAKSFDEQERRTQRTFLNALGQDTRAVDAGRMLSTYSSSVALDVLARTLAVAAPRVGLMTPTFDNIPDLFKRWRLELIPLPEQALLAGEVASPGELDTVFITTPNNPTGAYLEPAALASIAQTCASRGIVLALDVSFRGFDRRFQYNTYGLLDSIGVEYVLVEDTGKLWPTSELKAGFLGYSANCRLDLAGALSDVLLSVSPFILRLIEMFAIDAMAGGFDELHALVDGNRQLLRVALDATGAALVDPDSRISCARVLLPQGYGATRTYEELRMAGLHVLPCGPFHWSDPALGERHIRVALGRDPEVIERVGAALRSYFGGARGAHQPQAGRSFP